MSRIKINPNENGVEMSAIERKKMADSKKVPLRIDERTVILVPKKKATKKYAEEYKQRMIQSQSISTYNYTGGRK